MWKANRALLVTEVAGNLDRLPWPVQKVIGAPVISFGGAGADYEEHLRAALAGRWVRYTTRAGGVVWWSAVGPDGDGIIGVSVDATEREELVAELQRVNEEMAKRLRQIEAQQQAIDALEVPAIQVAPGVLLVAPQGPIASDRAARIVERTAAEVERQRARGIILELSGVPAVDTATAAHLLRVADVVRLLGCRTVITGIRPDVAMTIIALGIDMGAVRTVGTVAEALDVLLHGHRRTR